MKNKKIEYKAGETFWLDDQKYLTVADGDCSTCAFYHQPKNDCGIYCTETKQKYLEKFPCGSGIREDGRFVHFAKIDDPFNKHLSTDGDPYKTLKDVLSDAEYQASGGKGKERHATDNNFEEQVICSVQRLLYRHPFGGDAYQVIKKIIEAGRLYDTHGWETAYKETLGAINYAGAMGHLIKEYGQKEQSENLNNLGE